MLRQYMKIGTWGHQKNLVFVIFSALPLIEETKKTEKMAFFWQSCAEDRPHLFGQTFLSPQQA